MSMRKRRSRVAIKNLGARARTKKVKEVTKASAAGTSQPPPSTVNDKSPTKPLTFLEAYESAQKRISDLASHRERVLAEITQPVTVIDAPRLEHRRSITRLTENAEASSSTTSAETPANGEALPEVQPTPKTVRTSARLRGRRSEATSELQHHDMTHGSLVEESLVSHGEPATTPQPDEEIEEEDAEGSGTESQEEESEELVAMRRRVHDMGDGLIQAGKLLQEQAWAADPTWIMETLKRADRPGSSGELHAILFSRSKKRS